MDRIRNSSPYAGCKQNQNRTAVGEINKLYIKATETERVTRADRKSKTV